VQETKTAKLSDKITVEIKALNAKETMRSNLFLPAGLNPQNQIGMALAITQTQAICAVRKLNDDFVDPCKSDIDFDRVSEALSGPELVALGNAYNELAGVPEAPEELKNS
jgi:hypothetical protein